MSKAKSKAPATGKPAKGKPAKAPAPAPAPAPAEQAAPAPAPTKPKRKAKAAPAEQAAPANASPSSGIMLLDVKGRPRLWANGEQLADVDVMAEVRKAVAQGKADSKVQWVMPKYEDKPVPAVYDEVRADELAKINEAKATGKVAKLPPGKGVAREKITPGTVVKEREARAPRVARDPSKPGVIDSIVKVLSETKAPLTFEELDAKVCAIVGREPGACMSTIRAQLGGTRLATEKGVNVVKTGEAKPFRYRIVG